MVEPNNIQLGVVHETSSLRDATEKHGPCCKFGIIEICSLHCINFTNFYYVTVFLARSAKVAERAICFTVRNFFLFFLFFIFIFFNDFSETNYLKIRRTDFRSLYIE